MILLKHKQRLLTNVYVMSPTITAEYDTPAEHLPIKRGFLSWETPFLIAVLENWGNIYVYNKALLEQCNV